MTQTQASQLAARLTRVWKPFETTDDFFRQGRLQWWGDITEAIAIFARQPYAQPDLVYHLRYRGNQGGETRASFLDFDCKDNQLRELWFVPQHYDHCLDLFRRNCWLSGCPIEASAHEKAEWMQGFSREEIESWGLAF